MNINITQEVKDYLRGRGSKTIEIYTKLMTSCWSPTLEVFVRLREPKVLEQYNKYEADGITVYIFKDAIFTGDSIDIELSKEGSDFPGKELDIIGLEI